VSLSFELVGCTARLALTVDPDHPRDDWVISFLDVGDIVTRWYHDPETEAPVMGDFLGVKETALGHGRTEYHLDTGDAEVTFRAAASVQLTSASDS